MLPSTVPSVSASAKFLLSWLNPPPHPITVYASHPPLPTTAQHSLPGGALPPYRGRSFTGRNASASPDAPERQVGEAIRYALSRPVRLHREFGFENAGGVSKSGCVKGDIFDVCCLSHIGREAKSEPTFGPSILSKSSHSWRRSASGSAPGLHKRGDNQVYRARVLEVRIHLPPAESQQQTGGCNHETEQPLAAELCDNRLCVARHPTLVPPVEPEDYPRLKRISVPARRVARYFAPS